MAEQSKRYQVQDIMKAEKSKYQGIQRGHKVIGRIVSIRRKCTWGMQVGDEFELSIMSTGGICPYMYYCAYPFIMALQFGADFPDEYPWGGDRTEVPCSDSINLTIMQLRREGVNPARHSVYIEDEKEEERRWRKKLGID